MVVTDWRHMLAKYPFSIPNLKKEVRAGQSSIQNVSFLFWTLIFALNAFSSSMDSFDIIHVSSFALYKQGRLFFHRNKEIATIYPISFMLYKLSTCANSTSFSTHTQIIFFWLVFHQEGGHNKVHIHLCCNCPNVSTTRLIWVLSYFKLVQPPLRPAKVSVFIHITNSLASASITGPSIVMPTDHSRQNNWKSE